MTTVTIQIETRQVIGYLQSAPHRIDRAMRAAMEDSTVLLLREMRVYPPQRPGSTYKRTQTLKRSWFRLPVRTANGTIEGGVVSSGDTAPYNRRVQDQEQQAEIHRGRWTNTAQEVQRRNQATIQRYFDRRLREEFGR